MLVDSLNYSFELGNIDAYIITLKGNQTSETMSARCQESCKQVGMPFIVWEAFDGTSQSTITYPKHAENQDHYRWLKQMNDRLTITEVATILSHYSLWSHCAKIDKPIVILEHDAIMVKPYTIHNGWNQINYLGNLQQYQDGKFCTFPIHATATFNNRFICRAHAYAIDPAIARQMVSHVIRFGLSAPADMLMRVDLFNIVQTDFYAFDAPGETTITGRDEEWQKNAKEIFSSFL